MPPDRILWLIQSRSPADFVFRLGARSIDGVKNPIDMGALDHPGDPEWGPPMAALMRLQRCKAVGMRLESSETGLSVAMFLQPDADEAVVKDIEYVHEAMDLETEASGHPRLRPRPRFQAGRSVHLCGDP